MSSQSTKERKENWTVLHNSPTHDTFDAKCVKQYIEKKSLTKSKDYYKPIKTNSAFNGNYIAKRFHTNNQAFIDCLKPRPNKNECECKKCGCDYFYASNY